MKTFVYYVADRMWIDHEAFGEAWRQAKAYASELHAVIYRDVMKAEEVIRQEVYYKGGVFNSVKFAREDNVKIW